MTDVPAKTSAEQSAAAIERPLLSQWVWRPWYAKVWWTAIATYWSVMSLAFVSEPIADFYASDLGAWLTIAFYPVFALFFLSIGWMFAWVNALDCVAAYPEVEDPLGWEWSTEPALISWWDVIGSGRVHPLSNLNPASGVLYVGNPDNEARRTHHW